MTTFAAATYADFKVAMATSRFIGDVFYRNSPYPGGGNPALFASATFTAHALDVVSAREYVLSLTVEVSADQAANAMPASFLTDFPQAASFAGTIT